VISAAGMGTRLGMSLPKALVEVQGKPILARQLEMLADVEDVVVVAGFRSQLVLDLLRETRRSVRVALNHEFTTTGTAASVAKGAAIAHPWVLSLDGDLLVRPRDLQAMLAHPGPCLGVIPARSKQPVWGRIEDGTVVGLSQQEPTEWEWTGLAKVPREVAAGLGSQHVFHGLIPALPMDAIEVDGVEIDDLDDLDEAEVWVARMEQSVVR
jgi:choline kinase